MAKKDPACECAHPESEHDEDGCNHPECDCLEFIEAEDQEERRESDDEGEFKGDD